MNLKNLAKTLGLSETTVSRALNGYPEVSQHTRERVLAVARATGYRPNPAARNLAIGRTDIVGFAYPLDSAIFADPMFLTIVTGMSEALAERAMDLIIAPESSDSSLRTYERLVHGHRVDGLVLGRTRVRDERIAFLTRQDIPFVALGRTQSERPYAWFDYDNEAGMRLAVERLVSMGHQRIALISMPLDLNFARQRRDGFLDAMHTAGLTVAPAYLMENALDKRSGYQSAWQLLHCSPRPSAIITDNPLAGAGALHAMHDAGVALGRELSFIVWGEMEDFLTDKQVEMIHLPNLHHAGAAIIDMLLAMLDGKPPSEMKILWRPILLHGKTVGPFLH